MPDLLKTPVRNLRERDPRDGESRSGNASSEPMPASVPGRGVFALARSDADNADAVSREDEANMRRALGMLGGPTRAAQPSGNSERRSSGHNTPNGHAGAQLPPRRHRFVQDGEVPVTVVRARAEHVADLSRVMPASPVNRIDALQESLAAEQSARAAAERALEEAQATIRTLQTRLSHLELAREEALAQAQQAQAQQAQAQAQAEAAVVAPADSAADAETVPVPDEPVAKPVAKAPKISRSKPRKQSKPAVEEAEPEPVKWWLSSQAMRTTPAKRGRPRAANGAE